MKMLLSLSPSIILLMLEFHRNSRSLSGLYTSIDEISSFGKRKILSFDSLCLADNKSSMEISRVSSILYPLMRKLSLVNIFCASLIRFFPQNNFIDKIYVGSFGQTSSLGELFTCLIDTIVSSKLYFMDGTTSDFLDVFNVNGTNVFGESLWRSIVARVFLISYFIDRIMVGFFDRVISVRLGILVKD